MQIKFEYRSDSKATKCFYRFWDEVQLANSMAEFIKQIEAIVAAKQVITPEMIEALLEQDRIPYL